MTLLDKKTANAWLSLAHTFSAIADKLRLVAKTCFIQNFWHAKAGGSPDRKKACASTHSSSESAKTAFLPVDSTMAPVFFANASELAFPFFPLPLLFPLPSLPSLPLPFPLPSFPSLPFPLPLSAPDIFTVRVR